MNPARTFFCGLAMGSAMSLGSCSGTAQEPSSLPATDEIADSESDAVVTIQQAQTSLIRNAFIASPIAGLVQSVDVQEGTSIAAGTVLVQLKRDLAEKEVRAATASLQAARLESDNDVNLRFAKRSLLVREHELRQSELANETYAGAVTEMELREIRLTVDQATLAIEQAERDLMVAQAAVIETEAAVAIAESKLQEHTIRTMVGGMVSEIDVQPGEWVEAGKPLVRVISLSELRVEGFVDGTKFGRELIGRTVKFAPKGMPAKSVIGRVTFVSPELHPVTGEVRMWATIDNRDESLGSGMQGVLTILPRSKTSE
ncbi:MAG: HlyD family efflux transporter periplasmic adaptor subunit [Planctomycetota bacterium]